MTKPAIAADVHQSLDVHGDFAPEVAFYTELFVNDVAQPLDFIFRQVLDPCIGANASSLEELLAGMQTNAVDGGKPNFYALLSGKVDSGNTCHDAYPCRCLCFGLLQITRRTPLRRMTLHRSHRRTTDAATFIEPNPLAIISIAATRGGRQFYAHIKTHASGMRTRRLFYHRRYPIRQDFGLPVPNQDRVLEMSRERPVGGYHRPPIIQLERLVATKIEHWLDRQRHARPQPGTTIR